MGCAKGVMLSQRNLCAAIEGLSLALPQEKDGTTLALLPLHYAYESIVGLLSPLSRGIGVAFVENLRSTMQNAKETMPTSIICSPAIIEIAYKRIWTNIRKRGIEDKVTSLIKATDSIKIASLRKKSKKKVFAEIHNSFGGHLEHIIVGGSTVDPEAITGMQAFGFNVIQTYGLTESASLAAITPLNSKTKGTIGTALPIGELKIADSDSNGIGEICYRGDNVMLGYYKQEELNKEVKQNGWIRTGDIGSLDSDGYLTVLGRKKNTISVSHNRTVYPEELETLLFRSTYIKECAVIGIKSKESGSNDAVAVIYPNISYAREILGVYSSRPMIKEKISSLIADINTKLPQYKRISYFVLLDEEIPKNAYKKIERSTLPEYVINEYLAFEN
jgi:long-chain acyl-CoA synthetase